MALPVLRPGQTHPAVPKMKHALIEALTKANHEKLASPINHSTRNYGRAAVRGVKRFQRDRNLEVDGVVGEKTWRALGFNEPVVDARPAAMQGIPWEPGLIAIDGRWVDKALGETILAERRAGRWHGVVNSGYRPAWYQKRLWDAAVRKFGSEQAASKWVARPGTSRHGLKGGHGAVDVQMGEQLDASSDRLFRPMNWEPWHVQLVGAREMPEEPTEPPQMEIDDADLAKEGVSVEDVDESIDEVLQQVERPNDEMDEGDADVADDGFDPEAAPTAAPQGVPG